MRYISIVLLIIGFVASPFFQVSAASSFTDTVRGQFLLAVETQGQLWYVNPLTLKRTYVATSPHIYDLMREEGLGISNKDLEKIPVGLAPVLYQDTDGDGLQNNLEQGMGLLHNDSDTDDDGVSDGVEVQNHTNPKGSGTFPLDEELTKRLAGRIVLQVESRGEAWFIHPTSLKRYYLGYPSEAMFILAQIGLGITDENLARIAIDSSSPKPPTEYSHTD